MPTALAQVTNTTFADIIGIFIRLIAQIVPILIAVALLVFFWGLTRFIYRIGGGDEKAVSEGKSLMVWGIIALFVLVSVWGILQFAYGELGFPLQFGTVLLPQ